MSDELKEECNFAILHEHMNICSLMVHAQQVEQKRDKRKSSDAKNSTSFDGGSSKGRLDIKEKPRFKKRYNFTKEEPN